MTNCDCKDHRDIDHVHNLVPMYWEGVASSKENFSSHGVIPWLPISAAPTESDMAGAVVEMSKLRQTAAPIFVEAALKHHRVTANCGVR